MPFTVNRYSFVVTKKTHSYVNVAGSFLSAGHDRNTPYRIVFN